MRVEKIYILIFTTLLLVGCKEDNWFNHTVKYNGKTDKPEMVVTAMLETGATPLIYVNESVFFLDPDHDERDTVWRNDRGYATTHVRSAYLRDAEVRMSVNGAEPIALHGAERMDTSWVNGQYATMTVRRHYAYTADYVLQPGDVVALTVSHARYKQPARVTQCLPQRVPFSVESCEIEPLNPSTSVARMTLYLPAYEGNRTDMLCLRARAHVLSQSKSSYYDTQIHASRDTTYVNAYVDQTIYSQDLSFVDHDRTNDQLSAGYFGAGERGLYRAINTAEETLPIAVCFRANNNAGEFHDGESGTSGKQTMTLDSIVLEVMAVTRDQYLYTSSMFAAGYYHLYIPDPFGDGQGGNIIGDIQDAFDEMGSMEGIQLYSNVENAIGCVSAAAPVVQTIIFPTNQE